MSRLVSFAASGAINKIVGKATTKLIAHLCKVDKVKTASAPLATNVFIAVTIPVIGSTSKKLFT